MSEEAFERVGDPDVAGPFFFTCEHASSHVPEWQVQASDLPLLAEHWGWDIGAADLTRELIAHTASCGILSRFSRLVCDPNRDPSEETFIVREVEGQPVSFNRCVDEAEWKRRGRRYFDPYHDAIDRNLASRKRSGHPLLLCSIHSFTPVHSGRSRSMEIGVLFDDCRSEAVRLSAALDEHGFATALNEPYSGLDGLIYAARRHGRAHGITYLELEVRQDLIATPARAAAVGSRIAAALGRLAASAIGETPP